MAAVNIATTLGATDLDTKQLVTDLVNATKVPRQADVDKAKKKADVGISSIALFKSSLNTLKTAADGLGSAQGLNKLSIANTNTAIVTATAGGSGAAIAGNHSISVSALAAAQRDASSGKLASTTVLSASTACTVSLTISGTTTAIAIPAGTTVAGAVSAINAANLSVTATLVNNGSSSVGYQIVLSGASGSDNAYTVATSDASILSFSNLQIATNAAFKVNGIDMVRSSNTVTDALSGITLKLNRTTGTSSTTAATVNGVTTTTTATTTPDDVLLGVTYDSEAISGAITRFVEAYNLITEFIVTATGAPNETNELAGSLQGNAAAKGIRNQLRALLTANTTSSGTSLKRWAELGVELDRSGKLNFKSSTFKTAFENNPSDAVAALSNNASTPYIYSGAASGLAGDFSVAIYGLVKSTGSLTDITTSYTTKQKNAATLQTKLDLDIEKMRARYESQFSSLDKILSQMKSTSKNLDAALGLNKKDR